MIWKACSMSVHWYCDYGLTRYTSVSSAGTRGVFLEVCSNLVKSSLGDPK